MKKLFAVIVSMSILFSVFILPVNAADSSMEIADPQIPLTMTSKLIDPNGNIIPVTGYLRDTPVVTNNLLGDRAVTYDYAIPMSTFSHVDNVSGTDSSGYFSATITIYYTEYDFNPSEYLLTRVSGTWEDPVTTDGTRVSETADVFANCTGFGTNNLGRSQTKSGTIRSGGSMYTGFQYSIQSEAGAMGATMSIGISQSANRQWTLELECFPIDPT